MPRSRPAYHPHVEVRVPSCATGLTVIHMSMAIQGRRLGGRAWPGGQVLYRTVAVHFLYYSRRSDMRLTTASIIDQGQGDQDQLCLQPARQHHKYWEPIVIWINLVAQPWCCGYWPPGEEDEPCNALSHVRHCSAPLYCARCTMSTARQNAGGTQ